MVTSCAVYLLAKHENPFKLYFAMWAKCMSILLGIMINNEPGTACCSA